MGITRKMVTLLLCGVPAIGLGALLGEPWMLFWVCNLVTVTLFLFDLFRAPRRKDFTAVRFWEGSFELYREHSVTLHIENGTNRTLCLQLCDTPPESFRWTRTPLPVSCGPNAMAPASYAVLPTQRGAFRFGSCHVEVSGPMGLCVRRFALSCEQAEAPVYPDLEPMRKYRLLASRRQLNREDQSAHRVRGGGAEFAGIREYTPDDDTRKINWMATARTGKPMSNLYDVERNQQVMLALDLGRWMDAPLGPVTRLDRATELCAAVAQAAISSGDRVGLVLFDTEVRAFLKPGKGQTQMNRLLDMLYKARAGRHESSLGDMAAHVMQRMRHRGLVCVFSYLDGAEAAAQAAFSLWSLSRRHAVLFASLSDPTLHELSETSASDLPALYLKASAIYRTGAERDAARRMRGQGMRCLSAEPTRLLGLTVRQYMNFKRKT